jgi:diguanylate cyclase (GGDEF)-like protein/PAS domain S-box-containing protein
MTSQWLGLLANMAVAAFFISIWSNLWMDRLPLSKRPQQILLGLVMGLGAIAVMLMPVHLEEGIFFDLRPALIALSAFFGGPWAGGIAAALAGAYRIYAGGAGTLAGASSIVLAAGVGLAGYFLRETRRPGFFGVAALGLAVAWLNCMAMLIFLPVLRTEHFSDILLPVGTLIFATTLVGGLAMMNETQRRDIMLTNLMYRRLIETLPDCLNIKDRAGRFLIANEPTATLMHAPSAATLIGRTDFDFYPHEVAEGFLKDEREVMAAGTPRLIEQVASHDDGTTICLSTLKVPIFDDRHRPIGLITHNRDITERKRLERDLAESQQHFADAVANMPDGLAMFDEAGLLVFCNDQFRDMFSRAADVIIPGRSFHDILLTSIQRGSFQTSPFAMTGSLSKAPHDLLTTIDHAQFSLADGRWIKVRTKLTVGGACFVVSTDISRLKQKEAKLVELNAKLSTAAVTDGLTGLANRRAFDLYLENELKRARRGETPLSLLIVDVDQFKSYNDANGHPAGDEVLKAIADCLKSIAQRPSDLAARYGGEEFAVIMPQTTEEAAGALAHKLRTAVRDLALDHPGSSKGIVTVSIGVTTLESLDEAGLRSTALVRRADEALYAAKAAGRDAVRCWSGKPAGSVLKTA